MPTTRDPDTKPRGTATHPRFILEHDAWVADRPIWQSGLVEALWRPADAPTLLGGAGTANTQAAVAAPLPCLALVRHATDLELPGVQNAMGYFIPGTHCRQGDILKTVAQTGKPVWIERGSFLAPMDLAHIAERFQQTQQVTLVESGSAFGYDDRVLDVRALALYQSWGLRVALGLADLCLGDGAASAYRPAWAQDPDHLHLFVTTMLRIATTWDCDIVIKRPSSLSSASTAPAVDKAYQSLSELVFQHLPTLARTTGLKG